MAGEFQVQGYAVACVCVSVCAGMCALFTQRLCLCTQGTHACRPGVKGVLFVQAVCVCVCACGCACVCVCPRACMEALKGPSKAHALPQGGENHFWHLSRRDRIQTWLSRPTEGAVLPGALAAARSSTPGLGLG